jgi:hypothetical protein
LAWAAAATQARPAAIMAVARMFIERLRGMRMFGGRGW